jgi:molecular chaperone DnaJ
MLNGLVSFLTRCLQREQAMKKDHYIILGVSKGATKDRIKQAYRDMAKRYHPDSGGTEINETKFKEIQKAYEILGDTNRRAIYDAKLSHPKHPTPSRRVKKQTIIKESLFGKRSIVDEFFDGLLVGNYAPGYRKRVEKELAIEMILDPSEAQHGGLFPLTVPVLEPCPACGQSGFQFPFICTSCMGRGYVQTERRFSISIPPNTRDGTEVTIPLDDIGLNGVNLYVFISIEAHELF